MLTVKDGQIVQQTAAEREAEIALWNSLSPFEKAWLWNAGVIPRQDQVVKIASGTNFMDALVQLKWASSKTEARRLIAGNPKAGQRGAVTWRDIIIDDPLEPIDRELGKSGILTCGKKRVAFVEVA
jgi:hypothetical protein